MVTVISWAVTSNKFKQNMHCHIKEVNEDWGKCSAIKVIHTIFALYFKSVNLRTHSVEFMNETLNRFISNHSQIGFFLLFWSLTLFEFSFTFNVLKIVARLIT